MHSVTQTNITEYIEFYRLAFDRSINIDLEIFSMFRSYARYYWLIFGLIRCEEVKGHTDIGIARRP